MTGAVMSVIDPLRGVADGTADGSMGSAVERRAAHRWRKVFEQGRVRRPVVVLLGPSRQAVSGVSTHLNLLFESRLAQDFRLEHFQVGSEGRRETWPRRSLRLIWSPLALGWRVLRLGRPLVHINTSLNRRAYLRDLAYLIVARCCRAPVLYQIHGGELPEQFAIGPWRSRLLAAFLRLPQVIVVLAHCELESYRRFVPEKTVVLLPNGVDGAPFFRLLRTPAPNHAPLRLLFAGRLHRSKGLYEALCALWLVRRAGVKATLTIAGEGPEEAALRDLTRRLELEQEVIMVGAVFGAAKVELFGRSDIMLLPTYSEGLPYALLEAMAAGVPSIATPVGAIPDVMEDGVHGYLVPMKSAKALSERIVELASRRGLLAAMSIACRRRIAARYTSQRLVDDFGKLYRRMGE